MNKSQSFGILDASSSKEVELMEKLLEEKYKKSQNEKQSMNNSTKIA